MICLNPHTPAGSIAVRYCSSDSCVCYHPTTPPRSNGLSLKQTGGTSLSTIKARSRGETGSGRTSRSGGSTPIPQASPFPPSLQVMSPRLRRALGTLTVGSSVSCEIPSRLSNIESADCRRYQLTRQTSYRRLLLKSLGRKHLSWYRPIPRREYQRMRKRWQSIGEPYYQERSTFGRANQLAISPTPRYNSVPPQAPARLHRCIQP